MACLAPSHYLNKCYHIALGAIRAVSANRQWFNQATGSGNTSNKQNVGEIYKTCQVENIRPPMTITPITKLIHDTVAKVNKTSTLLLDVIINSLWLCDMIHVWHQISWSPSAQVMSWCPFNVQLLSRPVMIHCQRGSTEQTLIKFE